MRYIVGIDEVGRGCLAGPVVVAAVAVPFKLKPLTNSRELVSGKLVLRDSKKLQPRHREIWSSYIKETFAYSIARVHPRVIDRINISAAANLAAYRAVSALIKNTRKNGSCEYEIYLDGGLYVKNKDHQRKFFANATTVIRGDEKIKAVSLASIVAKVSRDKYMTKLHKKHPAYSFDVHKGYGTKIHRRAISKHGPSDVHRLTFLRK